MKNIQDPLDKNGARSAEKTGKDRRFPDGVLLSTTPSGSALSRLRAVLATTPRAASLTPSEPLPLRELAMLEAELTNQGFLRPTRPELIGALAKRASLEGSNWRWRARRMRAGGLRVLIDVPSYCVAWADELEAALEATLLIDRAASDTEDHLHGLGTPTFADREDLLSKLSYLDQLAAYILGERRRDYACNQDDPRRNVGLDLILRLLSSSRTSERLSRRGAWGWRGGSAGIEQQPLPEICLPVTRERFLEALRNSGLSSRSG